MSILEYDRAWTAGKRGSGELDCYSCGGYGVGLWDVARDDSKGRAAVERV
jgi:hypothetical protein